MTDQVQVVVRNGSNLPENNSVDGSVEVSYGGNHEGSFVLSGPALSNGSLNYAPRTTYYSYHDFSGGYHFDETKPGYEQVFDYKTKVLPSSQTSPETILFLALKFLETIIAMMMDLLNYPMVRLVRNLCSR
jgi:hypothetical protein